MITELKIENFKSFGSDMPSLRLGPLNFLVGANASGKSNLVAALRFLKIALLQNVEAAVAEFEGAGEVRNKIQRERKEAKPLRIQLKTNGSETQTATLATYSQPITASAFSYTVEIDLRSPDEVPVIVREVLDAEMHQGDQKKQNGYRMERTENQITIKDPIAGLSLARADFLLFIVLIKQSRDRQRLRIALTNETVPRNVRSRSIAKRHLPTFTRLI